MQHKNLYLILGFEPQDTIEQYEAISQQKITEAYHKKVLTCHPDKKRNDPQAQQKFLDLQAAYETLSNSTTRKDFHETLRNAFEAYHEQEEDLILCPALKTPSATSFAQVTHLSMALIPYQAPEVDGINVTALIKNGDIASESLLAQAKVDLKLAAALMSSSTVLTRFTLEQQYQLLFCLINSGRSREDILKQTNAQRLVTQLSTTDEAKIACQYALREQFSNYSQNDEKIQEGECLLYDWVIREIPHHIMRIMILSPAVDWVFLKYYLRTFGSQVEATDVVRLVKRFENEAQNELLAIYREFSSEKNKQKLHYCQLFIQIDDSTCLRKLIQSMIEKHEVSADFLIELSRAQEEKWKCFLILKSLFESYASQDLLNRLSQDDIKYVNENIMAMLRILSLRSTDPEDSERMDSKIFCDTSISNMLSYLEKQKSTPSVLQLISNLLTSTFFTIKYYNEQDQQNWFRLFFQRTEQNPNGELTAFIPLLGSTEKDSLLKFFENNESIFKEFMRILSIELSKSPDTDAPKEFEASFFPESKKDKTHCIDRGIVKQMIPTVDKLGLKDYFLELFPDSQDYYARFYMAKSHVNKSHLVEHDEFEYIKEVLQNFQKEWFQIEVSESADALQLLSMGLAYFALPGNDFFLFSLKRWVESLIRRDDVSCQDLLKHFNKPVYCTFLIRLLSKFHEISWELLDKFLEQEPNWVDEHVPPSILGNLREHWSSPRQLTHIRIEIKLGQYDALMKILSRLPTEDEKTVYTDTTLAMLSQSLQSVTVTQEILEKLEKSLQKFPVLLLIILDKIQEKEIPSFGSIDASMDRLRQKVHSQNPGKPEIFFLSYAQKILDRCLQGKHPISGDQLLALSKAHPEIAMQIQHTALSHQLASLKRVQQIISREQEGGFVSLEIDHAQQFTRIIKKITQIAPNLKTLSRNYVNYEDMEKIHDEILMLSFDKLEQEQQSCVELLIQYFPTEHPNNFILWILKIASNPNGSEISEDLISHWLTCQDFISTLSDHPHCGDAMLAIIKNSSLPDATKFKSALIKKVWEAIIPPSSLPITSFHRQVLLLSEELPRLLNELSNQLINQGIYLHCDRVIDIYIQLLAVVPDELQITFIDSLVNVINQMIHVDDGFSFDVKQGESFAQRILECRVSDQVHPSPTPPNIPLHRAIVALFHLLQRDAPIDSLQENIFNYLIHIATWQAKFSTKTHAVIMKRLADRSLLPYLLTQLKSRILVDENTVIFLLDYLLKDRDLNVEMELKESMSESKQEVEPSLLSCIQTQYEKDHIALCQNHNELINLIFERRRQYRSTPYLDQLSRLLSSYIEQSSSLETSQRLNYLENLLHLLNQLETSIASLPQICILRELIVGEEFILKIETRVGKNIQPSSAHTLSTLLEKCPTHLTLIMEGENHDEVSKEQRQVMDETLEPCNTRPFSNDLHTKSYLSMKFYQKWYREFIKEHGDNDSALYQLNQQLQQYIQTCRSQDIHTRRAQIKQLLQFVLACQQIGCVSSLRTLYEELRNCIEIEYDFVYRYLHYKDPKNSSIQSYEHPLLKDLEQRRWHRKLWSRIQRFFDRKRLQSVYIKAPHQAVRYDIVEHANACQQFLKSDKLDYHQWQILLQFYNHSLEVIKSGSLDQNNQRYIKIVSDDIAKRFAKDNLIHQQYLAANFPKIAQLLKDLLNIQSKPEMFERMKAKAFSQYGREYSKWPPLTLKIVNFSRVRNSKPSNSDEDEKTPFNDEIQLEIFELLTDQCIDQQELPNDEFVRRMKALFDDTKILSKKQARLSKRLQLAVLQQHCRLSTAEEIHQTANGINIVDKFSDLVFRALEHKLVTLEELSDMDGDKKLRMRLEKIPFEKHKGFSPLIYRDLPRIVLLQKSALPEKTYNRKPMPRNVSHICKMLQIDDGCGFRMWSFIQFFISTVHHVEKSQIFCETPQEFSSHDDPLSLGNSLNTKNMLILFNSRNPDRINQFIEPLREDYQIYRIHYDIPRTRISVEAMGRDDRVTSDDSVQLVYSDKLLHAVTESFFPTLFEAHQARYPQFTEATSSSNYHPEPQPSRCRIM